MRGSCQNATASYACVYRACQFLSQICSRVADRDEVQTIEVAMTNVKLEKFQHCIALHGNIEVLCVGCRSAGRQGRRRRREISSQSKSETEVLELKSLTVKALEITENLF